MQVRDYMTSNVTTLPENACLLDAALLIRRTGKRHLPIIAEDGRLVGIISDRDISRVAPSMLSKITPEEYNSFFEATPVTKAMTAEPITLAPEAPIRDAVSLLHAKKIGAVIVLEQGRVVGILTVSDMLGLLNELLCDGEKAAETAV